MWFVVGALVAIVLFAFRAGDFFDDRALPGTDGSGSRADRGD